MMFVIRNIHASRDIMHHMLKKTPLSLPKYLLITIYNTCINPHSTSHTIIK